VKYSAIVVLPHIFFPDDGPISAEECARLDAAADLMSNKLAPLVVTSGWAGLVSKVTHADAMASYLSAKGVTAVLRQQHSRDTVGDAVFTRRLLIDSVLVVTSRYHVARAREVFGYVFGKPVDVHGVPWPEDEGTPAKEQRSLAIFRETFRGIEPGDHDAIYARLRERHPFYNGEVYSSLPV
jgi:uncharacterized SAM-binding protein YcdF (DUF218 family)